MVISLSFKASFAVLLREVPLYQSSQSKKMRCQCIAMWIITSDIPFN